MAKFKGKYAGEYIEESKRVYRKLLEYEKICKEELKAMDAKDGTVDEVSDRQNS